jgi:adenylate cyclase
MDAYDAVLRFYHYESVLTPDAFQDALAAMEKAVELDPKYGLAWAMLAHLHADNHAVGFCEIDASLEKALTFAHKGAALEPTNQFVQDALTLVQFHRGDKASFLKHVEATLDLNPNAPYIIGVAGWHLSLFGEWERGLSLLFKGMQLNPYYPTWFHMAPFMDCYHRGDYEAAYAEALKFNYPELFWDPLMRTAALGQMDRTDEASQAITELLAVVPQFSTECRRLIGNYVKVPELVDALVEGLKKAGIANLS